MPFVGAGVSMAVRRGDGTGLFPSWKVLLLHGADRLDGEGKPSAAVREFVEEGEFLAAAQRLRDKLGALWTRFLQEQFDVPRSDAVAESLALARAVWGLGNKLILTTNYDRVLRWTCPDGNDDLVEWDIESIAGQAQLLRDGAVTRPTVWHGLLDVLREKLRS